MLASQSKAVVLLLLTQSCTVIARTFPRLTAQPLKPPLGFNETLAARSDITTFGLEKRQGSCGSCTTDYCCTDGVCIESYDDVCCGGYYCYEGYSCGDEVKGCCDPGYTGCWDGCIPDDGSCCASPEGSYCPSGQDCYISGTREVCCDSEGCEDGDYESYEYVDGSPVEGGDYSSPVESPTPTSSANVEVGYYTWTVTWTYWVTFYTYWAVRETSTLTSTSTVTTTYWSVYATDADEATSSWEDYSATITHSVPASATSPTVPTQTGSHTSGPDITGISDSGDSGSGGNSGIDPSDFFPPSGGATRTSVLLGLAAIGPALLAVLL